MTAKDFLLSNYIEIAGAATGSRGAMPSIGRVVQVYPASSTASTASTQSARKVAASYTYTAPSDGYLLIYVSDFTKGGFYCSVGQASSDVSTIKMGTAMYGLGDVLDGEAVFFVPIAVYQVAYVGGAWTSLKFVPTVGGSLDKALVSGNKRGGTFYAPGFEDGNGYNGPGIGYSGLDAS